MSIFKCVDLMMTSNCMFRRLNTLAKANSTISRYYLGSDVHSGMARCSSNNKMCFALRSLPKVNQESLPGLSLLPTHAP